MEAVAAGSERSMERHPIEAWLLLVPVYIDIGAHSVAIFSIARYNSPGTL